MQWRPKRTAALLAIASQAQVGFRHDRWIDSSAGGVCVQSCCGRVDLCLELLRWTRFASFRDSRLLVFLGFATAWKGRYCCGSCCVGGSFRFRMSFEQLRNRGVGSVLQRSVLASFSQRFRDRFERVLQQESHRRRHRGCISKKRVQNRQRSSNATTLPWIDSR